MNSAKHTPGPWKKDGFGIYDSADACIGRAYDPMRPKGFTKESIHANARLIAAAPELLEACKAAKEQARCRVCQDRDMKQPSLCDCYSCDLARMLSTAISKAERGQS